MAARNAAMKRPRVVTMAQGARAAMASAGPRMNVANMLNPTISQGCHLCTIPASERLVSGPLRPVDFAKCCFAAFPKLMFDKCRRKPSV